MNIMKINTCIYYVKWYDIGKKYRVVIPIIIFNSNSGRPQIEHNCLVHVSVICTPVAGYEPSAIQETSVLRGVPTE